MEVEDLVNFLKDLPEGIHVHNLFNFINGNVTLTKKGTVKFQLELGLDQIEASVRDIRAITQPLTNGLVPMLMFVDSKKVTENIKEI